MPTKQKAQIIDKISVKFKEANGIYITKYTGMNVSQATDLRKQFRESDVEYLVTKNTLTKIAAKNAGHEGKFEDILEGQIAIAYSNDDPTSPARIIKNFTNGNKDCLEVVGLFFEGEVFEPEKYKELANLPSREELLAKLVGGLSQPMTQLAATLNGAMSKLAATIDSLKHTKV